MEYELIKTSATILYLTKNLAEIYLSNELQYLVPNHSFVRLKTT